jgi:hypothetical protein
MEVAFVHEFVTEPEAIVLPKSLTRTEVCGLGATDPKSAFTHIYLPESYDVAVRICYVPKASDFVARSVYGTCAACAEQSTICLIVAGRAICDECESYAPRGVVRNYYFGEEEIVPYVPESLQDTASLSYLQSLSPNAQLQLGYMPEYFSVHVFGTDVSHLPRSQWYTEERRLIVHANGRFCQHPLLDHKGRELPRALLVQMAGAVGRAQNQVMRFYRHSGHRANTPVRSILCPMNVRMDNKAPTRFLQTTANPQYSGAVSSDGRRLIQLLTMMHHPSGRGYVQPLLGTYIDSRIVYPEVRRLTRASAHGALFYANDARFWSTMYMIQHSISEEIIYCDHDE